MRGCSKIPRVLFYFRLSAKSGQATFQAILDYARRHGPWQCLAMQDCGKIIGPEPWDKSVSGIITTGGGSPEASRAFARSGIPVVLMDPEQEIDEGHPLAHCPSVRCDSRAIGAMAAHHYLECGYRAFAWVGAPGGFHWSADRCGGFEGTLADAGFGCAAFEWLDDDAGTASAARRRNRLERFLRSLAMPVAIFAANDATARVVLNVCVGARLRVPEQVAVLGVDDDRLLCESTVPALSSIRKGDYRRGHVAATMLDALMRGRPIDEPKVSLAPLRVVERGSTGYATMDDPTIARAVAFIRKHAASGAVGVEAAARAAGCSRRLLERHFRARLGRSVHDEVVRSRVEHVKRLLETDTMPIGDIIDALGFADERQLSVLFKRMTGMTMRDWRRRNRD